MSFICPRSISAVNISIFDGVLEDAQPQIGNQQITEAEQHFAHAIMRDMVQLQNNCDNWRVPISGPVVW